ncbi:MAG: CHASE2 domain-containing protein [Methylococcaceae bacterium]|nr:CHASE2 domain-containing protein [Methylococcaceae bacterium]
MQDLKATGFGNQPLTIRSLLKGKCKIYLLGFAFTLAFLAFGIKFPATINRIDNAFTDLQIGLLPVKTLSSIPVIVEVDERSLADFGQWPWPRYQVARLLDAIKQYGPAAVGVDAVFAERDRTSPAEIQSVIARDFNQSLPLAGVKQSLWDYDALLGQTLKNGPFVLSYFFNFDGANLKSGSCLPKSASGALFSADGNTEYDRIHHAKNALCNVSPIQDDANASGFINATPDKDGIYRRTPLIINYQGRFYPSLALQSFLTANNLSSFLLASNENGLLVKAGNVSIPLDKSANLLIKFPSSGQVFTRISAADVLSKKLKPEVLKDKIVFVGFSAVGLHEFRPTPYSPQFLGVEFHAAIVDNLVRQDFLQQPDKTQIFELVLASIVTLALFVSLAGAGLLTSITVPSLLIIALLVGSQLLLLKTGIVISPALPVMMTAISFLILTLLKYISEYRRAKEMAILVSRTQEGIIGSFCSMSEYRDPETGAHIKRTQEYIKALAHRLRNHPRYKDRLNNETIELLFKAAPLHDIGKIGIRDHILLKNGRLDDSEFHIMKSHPQIGADIIQSVAAQIGWNPFMQTAHDICLYHQEKWDGSGYPKGLSGEEIPLAARFMAIADVYDALISKRVYKPAFSHSKAVALILEGKDKHFDPLIVDAFLDIHEKFRDIALTFLDSEEQRETLLADSC